MNGIPPRGPLIKDCAIQNCARGLVVDGVESITVDGLDIRDTPEPIIMTNVGHADLSRITVENRHFPTQHAEDSERPATTRRKFRPQRPARRN